MRSPGFFTRLGLTCLGVFLLPVAAACGWVFVGELRSISGLTAPATAFLCGFAAYLLIHVFFWKPAWIHVASHELSHAMASWIFGYRVHRLSVGQGGGATSVSGANIFTRLAPYVFPLYALALLALYGGLSVFFISRPMSLVFSAVIGAAVSFHLATTIASLHRDQPDLAATGWFFSVVLLLLVNLSVLAGFLDFAFDGPSFRRYHVESFQTTAKMAMRIVDWARTLVR